MSNKNKGKVVQMLSPENYIRKKARTLPIHECWINAGWEESGVANIVIARMHTNGNITFCLYLVDLYCLGVKDSFFKFNIIYSDYKSSLERLDDKMDMELTEYVLVHNIILSGVEYAEEFGFKPYKDFTSVTQFMLEEDTDDIELIEIECGKDGKPLFIQGPYENTATANKIIKQLEHIAGKDNFHFIQEFDPESDGDWGGDFENPYKDWTFEEKEVDFKQYYNRLAKLKEEEFDDFVNLLQSIVDDLMDIDEYNQFYEELTEELNALEVVHDRIPNEMLGLESDIPPIPDEIKQIFLSIIQEGPIKQKQKHLKTFRKIKGLDAAIDYLDVLIAGLERSSKYEKKLKEAATKHPNYTLLILKWTKNRITSNIEPKYLLHYPCKLENYFPDRDSIHSWELFCYLDTYTHVVVAEQDFAKLDALKSVINELDLDEDTIAALTTMINIFQVEIVAGYFEEKNKPEKI